MLLYKEYFLSHLHVNGHSQDVSCPWGVPSSTIAPIQISVFCLPPQPGIWDQPSSPSALPSSVPINSLNMYLSECFPLQLSKHFLSYKPLLFISWSQKNPQCRPQDPQRNSQKLRTGSSLKRWWIRFHPLDQGPILITSLCPDLPRQQEEQTSSGGGGQRWGLGSLSLLQLPPHCPQGSSITSLGCPCRLAAAPVPLHPTALDFFIVPSPHFVRAETLSHSPCIFRD